jgi:predicted small lipoprotein YifL
MKKILVMFLLLSMALTFAACGEDGGDKSPSESSAPSAASSTPSGETEKEEAKVYGIGESAEANGLSITIDKVETAGPDIMLEKARDGFVYMKVYFTFKNVSDETIESPKTKALYIVYEEGPTGDDCDMTSEENSQVILEVPDRDERYMSRIDLAPGEFTGGWMIYQRQADKNEVTMHYYSGFINVPPDLVFQFTAE